MYSDFYVCNKTIIKPTLIDWTIMCLSFRFDIIRLLHTFQITNPHLCIIPTPCSHSQLNSRSSRTNARQCATSPTRTTTTNSPTVFRRHATNTDTHKPRTPTRPPLFRHDRHRCDHQLRCRRFSRRIHFRRICASSVSPPILSSNSANVRISVEQPTQS